MMRRLPTALSIGRRLGWAAIAAAVVAATPTAAQQAPQIPKFSSAQPGELSPGWQHLPLASYKANTDYRLVADEGTVVLRATSRNAASYLGGPHQLRPAPLSPGCLGGGRSFWASPRPTPATAARRMRRYG